MKILLISLFILTSAHASECQNLAQESLARQERVNTLLEQPLPYNVVSPALFKQTEDIKGAMIACKEERANKLAYCGPMMNLLERRDELLLNLKEMGLMSGEQYDRVESRQDYIKAFVSFRCR